MTLKMRYLQLALVSLAGGAIYPLVYMRQNFELSMLEALSMTAAELQACYALLGTLFVITYVPSGWLADRFQPRHLMAGSLVATGLIGIWFSSFPSQAAVQVIFVLWGITSGLTFWAAMIKAVSLIAPLAAQGRFFGWLEGGRGAVEALLATLAIALFAWLTSQTPVPEAGALRVVVILYSGVAMLTAWPLLYWLRVGEAASEVDARTDSEGLASLWRDLKLLARNPNLWLAGMVMLSGYQLFWATYSFSAFIQIALGLSVISAGAITVARLWMRPIGAVVSGYLSDWSSRQLVLAALLCSGALALMCFSLFEVGVASIGVLAMVLVIGLMTYGARGVFWATLADCEVPNRVKGLAIGCLSLICYAPDVVQPIAEAMVLGDAPDPSAYRDYYFSVALIAMLGSGLALWLHKRVRAAKR